MTEHQSYLWGGEFMLRVTHSLRDLDAQTELGHRVSIRLGWQSRTGRITGGPIPARDVPPSVYVGLR